MSDQVTFEVQEGGIALITLSRPPSNALTPELRKDLETNLRNAIREDVIVAIVLRGSGTGFSAGVDFAEYDQPLVQPWVHDLCQLIENSPKPVVCALHGLVLGAGFELALSAHARVASKDARFSVSDVKLGLMPGSGGTQRLPRLIGAAFTLEFLLTGQVLDATDKRLKRVVTQITDEDPGDAALGLARDLAARGSWRRTCDEKIGFSDPKGYQHALAEVSKQLPKTNSVERDILNCVEAALLLPFDQGLAFENTLFLERITSPEARGPRHILMAEQLAMNTVGATQQKDVQDVVVIGGNDLGADATVVCLATGAEVTVLIPNQVDIGETTRVILSRLRSAFPIANDEQMQDMLKRFHLDSSAAQLSDADLVIDAGDGNLRPDQGLKPDVIWVALKPDLTVERMGSGFSSDRFFHLHFHLLEGKSRIAEWVSSPKTNPETVADVLAFLRRAGVLAVQSVPPAGCIGDRLAGAYCAAACEMMANGASPYEIDKAAAYLGFATGPCLVMDRNGLRQTASRLHRHVQRFEPNSINLSILQLLADKGRHGRSASRGFYIYNNHGHTPDPAMPSILDQLAEGDVFSNATPDQLGMGLLAAFVNEAVALLDERASTRASDLDLLTARSLGFDPRKGGPLLQADIHGIFALLKEMRAVEHISPIWSPHERIAQMVNNGEGFLGRNAG